VSWPRPAGSPWSRSGNSARWPRLCLAAAEADRAAQARNTTASPCERKRTDASRLICAALEIEFFAILAAHNEHSVVAGSLCMCSRSPLCCLWLAAFGVPACHRPRSLRSGPSTSTTEDRQGAGLEDLRHVDGVGALVDAEAGWRGADRLLACGSAAAPSGGRVAS
jgi:hypothetical protein